jgi:uncharacterized OB-fold protein
MSEPVTGIRTPVRLEYDYVAGGAQSRFLRGVAQRRILGQRCPSCAKVFVPPRGACPVCGVATSEEVEVADSGVIVRFCIVNLPFYGQALEIPYVCASVQLDGADVPLFHLIQEIPADQVTMGMRVEAAWVPADELKPSLESIRYFRPQGRPSGESAGA